MAFAAWFGLLATALNLFPIGQLDGGHISYAVLGRRSTTVTLGAICVAIGLTFFSMSWLVWTFLLMAMTLAMGPRHPRTIDEDIPLDRTRIWLAVVALVVFVLCFTPNPIEPTELLGPIVRTSSHTPYRRRVMVDSTPFDQNTRFPALFLEKVCAASSLKEDGNDSWL